MIHDLREISGFGDHPESNLLIHGHARDALEALTQQPRFAWRYSEQVKLAYLDPPFNTGSNFPHYRDHFEPPRVSCTLGYWCASVSAVARSA